jgi:hypothetical protein
MRRVTSFQCFTPENINQVVIDAFKGVGFMGPVFICSILFIGHWVMVRHMFGSYAVFSSSSFFKRSLLVTNIFLKYVDCMWAGATVTCNFCIEHEREHT